MRTCRCRDRSERPDPEHGHPYRCGRPRPRLSSRRFAPGHPRTPPGPCSRPTGAASRDTRFHRTGGRPGRAHRYNLAGNRSGVTFAGPRTHRLRWPAVRWSPYPFKPSSSTPPRASGSASVRRSIAPGRAPDPPGREAGSRARCGRPAGEPSGHRRGNRPHRLGVRGAVRADHGRGRPFLHDRRDPRSPRNERRDLRGDHGSGAGDAGAGDARPHDA